MRTSRLILLLLLATVAIPLRAQRLLLTGIDISGYPTVRAKLLVVGADGRRIDGITADDLRLTENGVPRRVISLSCPPITPPATVSLAMSIDVSGSMGGIGNDNVPVELGKATATELASILALPPSEMALQTCNHKARIVQDFTTNRSKILSAIPPIFADGGNDFVEHLLNPTTGLLEIARHGKYRRVAVLFTDAWWSAFTDEELDRCKKFCAANNITFYAVIYTAAGAEPNGIKKSLRALADATGGAMYDGVTDLSAARSIGAELRTQAQGGGAMCDLVWESRGMCDINSTEVVVTIPSRSLVAVSGYDNPPSARADLVLSQPGVSFVGVAGDKSVTVTARGIPIEITNIVSDDPHFVVTDYGGSPPPFTLGDGESRTIRIGFVGGGDSIYLYGEMRFLSDHCDRSLFMVGGDPRFQAAHRTFALVQPNGGEVFAVGADTAITWKGIAANARVLLEYSTDAGATWMKIADGATDLRHPWRVPPTPSDRCLARAVELRHSTSDEEIASAAQILPDHVGASLIGAWSPDGLHVATFSRENRAVRLWDAILGMPISGMLTGHQNAFGGYLAWSPDGARVASAKGDWDCIIWDALGAKLNRTTNQPAGFPYKFNFYYISWSPDGRYLLGSGYYGMAVWDATTGAVLAAEALGYGMNRAFWNSDGSRVMFIGNGVAGVWDWRSGKSQQFNVQTGGRGEAMDASAVSGLIASGDNIGQIKVVDPTSGAIVGSVKHGAEVASVKFSPDGTKVLSCAWDGTAYIIDARSFDAPLVLIDTLDRMNTVGWSPDGKMVAAAGWDRVIRVWSADGTRLHTLRGHGAPVEHLVWSPDGNRILSSADDGTARIWTFSQEGQRDTSDALWSIVMPSGESRDVDMKEVMVSASRDSLVGAFIRNTGTAPLAVRAIEIAGGDAADFSVASGHPPTTIQPGDSAGVEFTFRPGAPGPRSAGLRVIAGGDTLQQTIFGVGVPPLLEVTTPFVDFGSVEILSAKDTTVTATVRNIGSAPITITNVRSLGPDISQFSIVSGGGSFTLLPGDAREMTLRFDAKYIGRTSGSIGFDFAGPGSPAVMDLFARGVGGLVYVADDSARAGDRVPLALMLDGAHPRPKGLAGERFRAVLRFDQTLLAPEDRAAPGTVDAGARTITVEGVWDGASATLARIPMVALLGSAESTPLELMSFDWLDGASRPLGVEIETRSGAFHLIGVCREGGTRLYDELGVAAALKVAPNPASSSLELEYDLAEDGAISIELYDLAGTRLRSILDGERPRGSYRLRLSTDQLSSGSYLLTLRTPTQVVTRRVEVRK